MDFYDGAELDLLIDGQSPACLEDIVLIEVLEMEPSQNDLNGWERVRPNNQGFSISFSGQNFGAYTFLRNLKRSFTRIDFTLTTPDLRVNVSGAGYITDVSRSSSADNSQNFSAQIEGYGVL